MRPERPAAEFHELGLGAPAAISSAHGEGVRELMEAVLADFPEQHEEEEKDTGHPRVSIIARPNVGKFTLTNALDGEVRVIDIHKPDTLRDANQLPFDSTAKRS